MSEIRQQPQSPHGNSVAKKRKRIPESKNNSVQATGFAIGSSALTFFSMFNFEVQSFRCGTMRERFFTICKPFGMAPSDFMNVLLYAGIALGIVALGMLVLAFMMKLPDFPRWTVILFRTVFVIVFLIGIPYSRHYW